MKEMVRTGTDAYCPKKISTTDWPVNYWADEFVQMSPWSSPLMVAQAIMSIIGVTLESALPNYTMNFCQLSQVLITQGMAD